MDPGNNFHAHIGCILNLETKLNYPFLHNLISIYLNIVYCYTHSVSHFPLDNDVPPEGGRVG